MAEHDPIIPSSHASDDSSGAMHERLIIIEKKLDEILLRIDPPPTGEHLLLPLWSDAESL